MRRIKGLLVMFAMSLFAASAFGDIIKDPAAGVEAENFSQGITTFTGTFSPVDNGGVLSLFNDTGHIITGLELYTRIAKNLTPDDINSSFTCGSGNDNPFFLTCEFVYNSTTGDLTIRFFGENPPDGNEFNGTTTEVGEHEGIPPVFVGCPFIACASIGHFAFVFNNNFQLTGDVVNGWDPDTTSSAPGRDGVFLFDGPPIFLAPAYSLTPEPSSVMLFGGGLLALAGLARRRVGRNGTK